ncbi:MAG: Mrp/NBP35 family ATP-binding protein [Pseudomonadota bacterium]
MANEALILKVRSALADVQDPVSGGNIVAAGKISGLAAAEDGVARFALDVGGLDRKAAERLLSLAKAAAARVEGVTAVSAVATAHSDAPKPGGGSAGSAQRAEGGHDNPLGLGARRDAPPLPDVKNVVAIASGKGGVGKSTVAANLAVAFAARGLTVGLLDADIYGPSLPTLFGMREKPPLRDGKIVPMEKFGVRAMSIGLLVSETQALAWRGPMVMGAVRQLINDVDWGPLDLLLIDTPPGTGDVHLSLAQTKRLTGAVIVSTPQEMALADVRRGVELFRKTKTPVIGVIENMAYFETAGGARTYLFGEGGAEKAALELDAPFLGRAPILPDLRSASDAGAPLGVHAPHGEAAKIFAALAEKITPSLQL